MLARFWTRKCDGTCNENDPHDSHLAWFGRWYFSRFWGEGAA